MQIQKKEKQFGICQHFKKLTKKQISNIVQHPPDIMCFYHSKIQKPVLCLHCNQMFCSAQNKSQTTNQIKKQSCIDKHRRQGKIDYHIFSINVQQKEFNVYCSQCLANIQKQKINETQISQDHKKLKRFLNCLEQMFFKLKQFYEQEKNNSLIYRGLNNLGNTCFLNVVLQSLNYSLKLKQLYKLYSFSSNKNFSSPSKYIQKQIQLFYDEVLDKVSQNTWHVVKNKKNYLTSQTKSNPNRQIKKVENCGFNKIFKMFLQQLEKHDQQPFSPIDFLQQLTKLDDKYQYNQEQDAQQTLLFIIDILVQGQLIGLSYQRERYNQIAQHLGKQKITPLQRVIGTYLVSEIYCKQCKKISLTFDLTYHISISIKDIQQFRELTKNEKNILSPKKEQFLEFDLVTRCKYLQNQKQYYKELRYPQINNQLQKSNFLGCFFKTETLSKKENYYQCSNCPSLVGQKKFYLVSLPQILIISIKRFDHKMKKDLTFIQFPQILDVSPFCLQIPTEQVNCQYQLYGVIVHLGSQISNGHYVCYIKCQNEWLRFSDSLVRKVTWGQVKNQEAYVLFYNKKNITCC